MTQSKAEEVQFKTINDIYPCNEFLRFHLECKLFSEVGVIGTFILFMQIF